jgi:hypothetical protein
MINGSNDDVASPYAVLFFTTIFREGTGIKKKERCVSLLCETVFLKLNNQKKLHE